MTKWTDKDALDPVDVAIGEEILRRRKARKMTQAQLAEATGVTFQQLQKYERGVNRVSAARLLQIATALGDHPGAFFPVNGDREGAEERAAEIGRRVLAMGLDATVDDLAALTETARDAVAKMVKALTADFRG